MADVRELTQESGDEHYCTNCGGWYGGLSTDDKVVLIEGEEFVMPVENFNVDDYVHTRRTCASGCYTMLDNDDWETRIYDVVNGDEVYECTECDSVFPEREMADSCC